MFDQILQAVKEHIGNNPELAAAIPAEHADAIHNELATHIHENLQSQAAAPGQPAQAEEGEPAGGGLLGNLGNLAGGLFSNLESKLAQGGLATDAITGGLVGALTSKLGLPTAVTGAIAAALPGLLQKFAQNHQQTPATPAN